MCDGEKDIEKSVKFGFEVMYFMLLLLLLMMFYLIFSKEGITQDQADKNLQSHEIRLKFFSENKKCSFLSST